MTKRKLFHVVLGLVLLGCLICPYVEMAIDWNETIFTTGYDTESTVAVIALLLILAVALAMLLPIVLPTIISKERLIALPSPLRSIGSFVFTVPAVSPPFSLRI